MYMGTKLVEEVPFDEGLVHGREVTIRVKKLLAGHGLGPSSLSAVGVSVGPGSYTGIRVGVTAAKTLAFALGLAVVPVSSLEAIACTVADQGALEGPREVVVLIDGKQRHVYVARFRVEAAVVERLSGDQLVDLDGPADAVPTFAPEAVLVGDGVDAFLARIDADVAAQWVLGEESWRWPRASALGRRAVEKFLSGDTLKSREEVHGLVPVYLRPSEAERRLAKRRGERT